MNPPAVPLIACNPYFSVWSMNEKLTDNWPKHWSGAVMGMCGMVWVDGNAYRWCGPQPESVPAAEQQSVSVNAASTAYRFRAGDVVLSVVFHTSASQAGDIQQCSRSVAAVGFFAGSMDHKPHDLRVYLDVTGEWCTNNSDEKVAWNRFRVAGIDAVSMGSVNQPVLVHTGDQRKIDWGRLFVVSDGLSVVQGHTAARRQFALAGNCGGTDDLRTPRAVNDDWPVIATSTKLNWTDKNASEGNCILIAYDDQAAIELFGRQLKPLWQAEPGSSFAEMLAAEWKSALLQFKYPSFREGGGELYPQALMAGGGRYANMLTLAYRQVLAGHGIAADWDGTPMMFSKENTSNGCIATVDVIYPACPFFLCHNPAMLRAQLLPLMQYAASPRWKFPFAPHDLGQYPKANGQVYGGGERTEENQMPVEESGNMLIMLGALAKVEPKESVKFCEPYWPTLEKWAVYLKENGLDPANQLCTDDFAGHLARNVNLSAKTVVALGAYSQLLAAAGKQAESDKWRSVAQDYAKKWIQMTGADGPSDKPTATPLVFGDAGKGTWSQKYNLIWDRVLGMNLFPQEVFEREMALYRTKLQKYGLPLDSRRTYTKLDWTCWTACLTGNRDDFDAVMAPVLDWANASPPPSRVPLSDWYETTDGKTQGMYARTVVGGLWMPLLIEKLKQPHDVAQPPVK